jgi:hypothetical protein
MADLVLKLKGDFAFGNYEARKDFARFVAGLLSSPNHFDPQELNDGRNKGAEWTVDRGNDWWVFFDPNDKKRVRIKHRNDVREALTSLGGWIAYRYYCEVVTPEYQMNLAEPA